MRELQPRALALTLGMLCAGSAWSDSRATEPILLEIVAEQDHASPDPLAPFDVLFILHADGNLIQGMEIPTQLNFSNGNILGVMAEFPDGEAQVIWSPVSESAFASRYVSSYFGDNPTSPDTMHIGLTSFGQSWQGSGVLFRIRVTPSDTGAITFDTLGWQLTGDWHKPTYFDPLGGVYPDGVYWNPTVHVPPQPGTVRFRISTSSGTDTLFFGVPGTIYFDVDAQGNEIAGLVYVLEWEFSNGNIVGPISESTGEIAYSPAALGAFESISLSPSYGMGTDPDSTLLGLTSFDSEFYTGSDWIWSVTFQASDTGTIYVHPFNPGLANITDALDAGGASLPFNFIPGRIVVVPCPYTLMGDVNQDTVLTSSDLIYFINYLFKSGPDPLPDRSIGDVNCSGGLTGADIIVLVNYIFKSGPEPCACIVRRI